ncbi:MAG: UDP-N-acetylmuramoyl-tripeptide--D-alanyl-D-alanine ligase [Candidatus Pacebacteria bacterium]|nr:UDP-N-acetylmuramoyl-tripeptide--D-alanyl-D-alanine ligase [Candidatus Paceibacterota bacterium]
MNFLKKAVIALLTLESRLIIAKYKPFIIAVTGSVGKTSTKDAIYSVLKDQSAYVRKSEKSMNSEIGLPLTVIGVPNAWKSLSGWMNNLIEGLKLVIFKVEYPDTLILEIGADHPGDIRRVAEWLHADIVVITQVSTTPVHVEFFASPEEVFEEKASLARALKNGGTLILFADNEKVMSIADRIKEKNAKVISFGTSEKATVRGSEDHITYAENVPVGTGFTMTMNGTPQPVYLKGIIGRTYMYPLLAAAAVGQAKNIPVALIVEGLNRYDAPRGRMRLIPGMNGSTLIDDTYNSSPDAALAALHTLKAIETSGAKIAILSDMMELGQYSTEQHRSVGREVVGAASMLVTAGQRSRGTADEALRAGMSPGAVHAFDTALEAADYLKPLVKTGDVILVKGSQSMRMERAVAALMRDPEQAGELLVRQETEWLER